MKKLKAKNQLPSHPIIEGWENEVCTFCGQKGHWRPDCAFLWVEDMIFKGIDLPPEFAKLIDENLDDLKL